APLTFMRVVEVRASRTILMGLIGDMREWLDQNGGTAVHFSVEREGAGGIVTVSPNLLCFVVGDRLDHEEPSSANGWSERCRSLAGLGSPVGKRPTARNLDLFTLPVGSAALAHKGAPIALEADKRNLERIVLRIAAIAENDPIAGGDALGQADL